MTIEISKLLENNRTWAEEIRTKDPLFFSELAQQQSPRFLWIGCSDSRVPANQITGLAPGEVFVHRNISNLVINSDVNLLAVLQFAIDSLQVEHIIVCGHYGCGGVRLALGNRSSGAVEYWINHIRKTIRLSASLRASRAESLNSSDYFDQACEVNVKSQINNLAENPHVLDAWQRGQSLTLHGWIYRIEDGLIRDLEVSCSGPSPEKL
jgi:carbonic anhydrase